MDFNGIMSRFVAYNNAIDESTVLDFHDNGDRFEVIIEGLIDANTGDIDGGGRGERTAQGGAGGTELPPEFSSGDG